MTDLNNRIDTSSDAYRAYLITRQQPFRPRPWRSDMHRIGLFVLVFCRALYRLIGKGLGSLAGDMVAVPSRYCPERHYMRGPGPMTQAKTAQRISGRAL